MNLLETMNVGTEVCELGCVIFAVVVFAILNYFDLIWYMW